MGQLNLTTNQVQARLDESYINKGLYTDDPTLSADEYITYQGAKFFAITPGYTCDSATYPDPNSDQNLRKEVSINSSNIAEYSTLAYKGENGSSSIENMVAEFSADPLRAAIGSILKTGGTDWEYIDSTGPITEANFRAFNAVNILDHGAVGDDSTNNDDAFDKAFALLGQNSTMFIPDGIYRVTPSKIFKTTGEGQRIVGSSKNKCSIVFGTIQLVHASCGVQNLRMYGADTYGILIDDDRTEAERQSSYSTVSRRWVDNCDIGNKTYGIALTDTGFFARLTDNHVSGNDTGIWLANDQSVSTPLFNASWDRGDTFISDNTISGNTTYGIYAKNHGTALVCNNKIIGNGINFFANPDRSGGRDERVMQMFMSNNSLENATSARNFSIVSVADNGSGKARFTTSTPHDLPETHAYAGTISGTTSYNATQTKIFYVSSTQFDTEQNFVADETGDLSLPGWDMYVAPNESGACAYWNITGGDINQYNIETGANFNIHNVNVKYQRRYGSTIDSFSDIALINGTDRTASNDAIDIFPSGDYNDGDLFGMYTTLNGMKRVTSGLYVAKRNIDATGANQQPSSPNENGNVFSGTYSAAQIGPNSNVTSVTHIGSTYLRIGNTVQVSGSMLVEPTAAADTFTAVRFTLPVVSNLASSSDLNGVGSCSDVSYAGDINSAIQADSTNDCAFFVFKAPTTDTLTFRYTMSYTVTN